MYLSSNNKHLYSRKDFTFSITRFYVLILFYKKYLECIIFGKYQYVISIRDFLSSSHYNFLCRNQCAMVTGW